ncbi:YMGG-like glycine zipper-containing protein [Flammeovirgaceae bacterium SG7u.111]|nr:YMGG-like glycine zipper-containing protein [Flammeovirgaceae bacterium SG7u.132]WPO34488.1 YMGG-like glycine zipper-containing protein [Flammeovirgaceae bacterium SG7u.111]
MRKIFLSTPIVALLVSVLFLGTTSYAQTAVVSEDGGGIYAIAPKIGLYVFPNKGQDAKQQEKDEFESYKWAVEQTGIDPLSMPEVRPEQVETGPDGSAVRGAARGAATGALIGAIAGDTGKGAAIGATAGALGGHAGRKARGQHAQAAANASAEQQEAEMLDNFKRAFTASMEGRGYTVK